MSTTFAERGAAQAGAYGGVIDAIGGIAAAVIAIVGLSGYHPEIMGAVATIVFGAALLIEGGTLLSEYTLVMPAVANPADLANGGISVMFLTGVGGIVLGILALLGIAPATLTAVSVIAFGAAMLMSAGAVRHLFVLQSSVRRATVRSGGELIAGEMASGSAGVHVLSGVTALVLGIVAVASVGSAVLTLTALLVLGATFILTGSSLSGLVMEFMRDEGAGHERLPRTPL
jgi:hypothetical protein